MTYSIGDKFYQDCCGTYVLAQVSAEDGQSKAALINVDTGGLWHHPQEVGLLTSITAGEMDLIKGGDKEFTIVKKQTHS